MVYCSPPTSTGEECFSLRHASCSPSTKSNTPCLGDLSLGQVPYFLSKLSIELSGVELFSREEDPYVLSVSLLLFSVARARAMAATCSPIVGSDFAMPFVWEDGRDGGDGGDGEAGAV